MEKEVLHSPGKQLQITECLKSRLYPYQVEGLEFFYNAYKKGKKGIILADEMGLGKSIQVISFLASVASVEKKIPSVLLVVPTNLLDDWLSKIEDWAPGIRCLKYHQSEKLQARNLNKVKRKGGILITTYRMIIGHEKDLSYRDSSPYVWNFMVFDEAHRLKNEKTKTYKVTSSVQARFRILLTGTPIQNNLKEFWNLLSLISETCILGTYQTFRKNFENPITRGREADAKADERALAQELIEYFKSTIQPVWLRRTKDGLPKLPEKREFVLWTKLTTEQEAEYRHQLSVNETPDDLPTLKLLHNLRKICCFGRQFERHALIASESQIAHSGKLAVLIALLKKLSSEEHKILVFFQYIETLKIVRYNLDQTDWAQRTVLFMDGSVKLTQRTRLLTSFQKGSHRIFLLTVQVGAEGLNLTTADRVIIMEPSWNQCADAQAVDRVHRIGQKREVEVYRFITCGTVEEKIYRRQLFKGSLARQAVGDDQNPLRHFTRSELMELKSLGETQYSATQVQLEHQNSKCLSIEEVLGKQLGEQISGSLCGISDHSQLLKASQDEDLEAEMEKLHIADEVQRSKEEIEGEAHLKYTIPFVDARTQKNRPQTLGVHLKGKENGTILNDYQNKRRKNKRKSLINPVYSVWYSGKTPGLPRKYKQFSSPFTGSIRRKRRITCPPQYLDPDQSCHIVNYFSSPKDVSTTGASLLSLVKSQNQRSDLTVVQTSRSTLPSTSFNDSDNSISPDFTADSVDKGRKVDPLVYLHASDLSSKSVPGSISLASTPQMDKRPHLAELQSAKQLESPCQFSLFSSPVPLLCDNSLAPESVSLANSPHIDKTPQVLGVYLGSDPEEPQTEESERQGNILFRDPHQSEHEVGYVRVLENLETAHSNTSANFTDLSVERIHIADEGLRNEEEIGENGFSFNSPGVIKDHPSYNSVQVSPEETCSINHNPTVVNVFSKISLNASGLDFLSPKTVPITHVNLISETDLQHPEQELSVAQAPWSASTPLKNHLADLQSAIQLGSHCQIDKSSSISSPVPLLCDYSLTPGSVSVASTLHMDKTPQVSGVCPSSHHEVPQTEKSESHRSTSFRDPHQSHQSEYEAGDVSVLENSVTAHNNASANLTGLSTQSKLTLSTTDEGKSEDLEAEIGRIRIVDEGLRSEKETSEKDQSSFNCKGVIEDDDMYNSVQVSPEETCSINHNLTDDSVLRTISLNASGLNFLIPKTVPITHASLLSETEFQQLEQGLHGAQTPRSTSIPVKNHGYLAEPPSTTQLESPYQIHKSSSFSSPAHLLCDYSLTPGSVSLANTPHIEKTSQVLGVHLGSDPEEPQTEESERQGNILFRDPHQSEHEVGYVSVLENSETAHSNASANFTDLSVERIHIADEGLRNEEEIGENGFSFNSPGVIKGHPSYNSVQVYPDEICSINHNPTDVNVFSKISLNASGLDFLSPKTVPITHVNLISETDLQHPEQELSVAQAPRSASTPLKNHLADPQSPIQLGSHCQIDKSSSISSPVPLLCDYSLTPGSVSVASTLHMDKTPQVSGICPSSHHEVPQTEKSERHWSTSFRDPHQSHQSEYEAGDVSVLENSVTAHNNASANLTGLSTQSKLTLSTTDEGKSEDLEAEIGRIRIVDEGLRSEEETSEKDQSGFNCKGVIEDDDMYNSVQVSPEETCSINHNLTDDSVLRTISLNASGLNFFIPKTVPITYAGLLSETEFQQLEQELRGAQTPRSTSIPVKNHGYLAEPPSTTQLESPCQIHKSSSFSSPAHLLCDFSLTPGSLSLANTPHIRKTPQVLGVCPDDPDPEEPQAEKNERQSSASFSDPLKSGAIPPEYFISDILAISPTAHNTATNNLRDFNPVHNNTFNYSVEGRTEDPELHQKLFHNADEVQRSEEDIEKGEVHLNCHRIITSDDSDNSSQSSPEETYFTNYRMTYANAIRRVALNGSCLNFLTSEAAPFTQDNLLSESELQHPGQELSIVQTPTSTSTPVRNHDFLVYPQSPTQLESPGQILKLSLSLSSPISPHMDKTQQVSDVCPGSDSDEPQTEKGEKHISALFRHPHQSDHKLQNHEIGDDSVLENSTAHSNVSANLTDMSIQSKLTLDITDEGKSEDLEAEIRKIHIADIMLRTGEEIVETDEASFNSPGDIKDHSGYNSVQVSPNETCSINHNPIDVSVLRTISLNASGVSFLRSRTVSISDASLLSETESQLPDLEAERIQIADVVLRTKEETGEKDEASFNSPGVIKDHGSYNSVKESPDETSGLIFLSPKTIPKSDASFPSETELQHPEDPEELGGAQAPKLTSTPVKNHDYLSEPLSTTQLESPFQINKLSLFSSPLQCNYSDTGSVSLANTLHMEKTPQVLGVCPGSHPEKLQTEKSERHRSTLFRDPHQLDDKPPDHSVSDILEISGTTHNTATVDLRDIRPVHNVTFKYSHEGRIEDPKLERKSFQIADEMQRSEDDIEKGEVHLNCQGSITDDSDNSSESSPEETCSTNYRMTYDNVIRRVTFNARALHFLSSETVPFIRTNSLSESGPQHPEQELGTVQTHRSTSTLVQNLDFLVDPLSPTRLESPCQLFKSLSSLSSPISLQLEKTPQVSGVCPGNDPEELQTEKSESQSSNLFRDSLKSNDKLPEHQVGDDSVLGNSTAHNNASSNLTDFSTQSMLTLNASDEGKSEVLIVLENSVTAHISETELSSQQKLTLSSNAIDINEDLKTEFESFHIADEGQRCTGVTKCEANIKCQEVSDDEKNDKSSGHSTFKVPHQRLEFCKMQ